MNRLEVLGFGGDLEEPPVKGDPFYDDDFLGQRDLSIFKVVDPDQVKQLPLFLVTEESDKTSPEYVPDEDAPVRQNLSPKDRLEMEIARARAPFVMADD
jgi:hypothetical protein